MYKLEDVLLKDFKPDPKAVGLRIKEIRFKLGYSMAEFARHIDDKAKSGTVSNWETGKNLPNNKRLKRIAELGDVSLLYLLKGEKSLFDLSDHEVDSLLNNHEDFVLKYSVSRTWDFKLNFIKLMDEDLSDWQLSLLNNSIKLILTFADNDEVLSLFDSLIENSRIVLSEQFNKRLNNQEDSAHSAALLEDDINTLKQYLEN
ncbi:helix-turn-helix transcriptional regulator [Enterococcus faecalis]|uniref:helix-turn-helix domain-containing protein n=1 Tax=Enterococcus faecalis TaxID=1351 RepID=UPI0015722ECC|nr:helix-turn-helix transcriptional regulator [Enterococcus faecalis]